MNKVWLVVRKEWREVFKDKIILWASIVLPILFIGLTVGTLYFMERADPSSVGANDLGAMEQLLLRPEFAGMEPGTVVQILMLNQYLFYYLMLPLMLPLFVAVYSIIGEKQQRTLEPLLATPIEVWELLLGKTLSGVLPAVALTWASYIVTVLLSVFLVQPPVLAVMVSPTWLLAILVMAPLLSVTSVTVGVIISSRVNDVRLAEQLGGVLVLPLIGISVPVLMGRLLLSTSLFLIGAAAVALLNVGLLYVGIKLFQRETILTRWK